MILNENVKSFAGFGVDFNDLITVKEPAFDADRVCALFKEAVTLDVNMRNL